MNILKIFIILTVFLITARIYAQKLKIIQQYTATSDVFDIAISENKLLFATSGGLIVHSNGIIQKIITSLDGLPGTRVRSISITPQGTWIGTIEGLVLARFDNNNNMKILNSYNIPRVQRVVYWQNAVWIATYGKGLFKVENGNLQQIVTRKNAESSRQTDLLVHDNELWISTAGSGIVKINKQGEVTKHILKKSGLGDNIVWDLDVSGSKVIAATANGISVINGNKVEKNNIISSASQNLPIKDVRKVITVGSNIIAATFGSGVWQINTENGNLVKIDEKNHDLLRARTAAYYNGKVYIGNENGIYEIITKNNIINQIQMPNSLYSADITSMAKAFNSIWLGTFRNGLTKITDSKIVEVNDESKQIRLNKYINDLEVTKGSNNNEILWIATNRGLYLYDGYSYTLVNDSAGPGLNHVTSLYTDPVTGALLVTDSQRLSRFYKGQWQSWSEQGETKLSNLQTVTTDQNGNIWIGSLYGLYSFNSNSQVFNRYTVSSGQIPVDWVTAIVPWNNGIVAGTYHGGLSWFNGNTFQIEKEGTSGIPSGWVNPNAMEYYQNKFWIGTLERGLIIGSLGSWSQFTINDGLPCNDITAILPEENGNVWIASRGGVVKVRFEN